MLHDQTMLSLPESTPIGTCLANIQQLTFTAANAKKWYDPSHSDRWEQVTFRCYLVLDLPINILKSLDHHQVNVEVDVIGELAHRRGTVDRKLSNRKRLSRTQFICNSAISIELCSIVTHVVVGLYRMWSHNRNSWINDLDHGSCLDL
jgi:hypothetical protein